MNYIKNINSKSFFDELNKVIYQNDEDDKEKNYDNICLISYEPLEKNHIKLICGHKFNYKSIFNELKYQLYDNKVDMYSNKYKTKKGTIKCPFCRNIQKGILPKRENYPIVKYVNSPASLCMKINNCKFILTRGKNMGKNCNKQCEDEYCLRHIKVLENKNMCKFILTRGKNKGKYCNKNCNKNNEFCVNHLKKISKEKEESNGNEKEVNIKLCNNILKTGKNKGKICGRKCHLTYNYCKYHLYSNK